MKKICCTDGLESVKHWTEVARVPLDPAASNPAGALGLHAMAAEFNINSRSVSNDERSQEVGSQMSEDETGGGALDGF